MQADSKGRLFVNGGKETAVITRKPDGTWDVDKRLFSRLGTTLISSVFPESDGVAWLQFYDGRMVRFDTAQEQGTQKTLSTLVRGVQTTRGQPVFGGAGAAANAKVLEPDFNSLRFEFAAPTYFDERATDYQSRLDGFDDDWSPWARDAKRELTNLGPGSYRFRVRARNVTGIVADEASYAFTIQPPWYRTWLAYGGYAAAALLLMAAAASLQRRRVVARERERAQFAEARVRAEAAEQLARTESDGKRNVELLSEIGREITASLDFDTIFGRLYERVNELADADVFGVGLYHPERQEIEYRLAIEQGKRYTPYTRTTTDRDQLPVWCIEHKEPIFINDLKTEYGRYISALRREGPAPRGRDDLAAAAVAHLPAAPHEGSCARHHHDPELREERLYGTPPERDAQPGVVHVPSRSTTPTPTGSSTSTSTRSGACSRRRSRRGPWRKRPTPPRARSCRRSATSCARR